MAVFELKGSEWGQYFSKENNHVISIYNVTGRGGAL